MSKKRIGTPTALLVIMQLGQLCWLGWLQYSDWDKTAAASGAHVQMQAQVAEVARDLEALRLAQADLTQLLDGLKGTAAQLGALDVRVEEVEQISSAIGTSLVDASELRLVVTARLDQLSEEVASLKRAATTKPAPRPAVQPLQSKSSSSARVAKAASKPTPTPPPFTLLGIETRAGESFASVARNDAQSLDEVQLLRRGEAFQSWRLLRVEDHAAVFVAGGEERVVSIR
ncbi:hypothetical protein ACYCFK_09380 [Stutzerimonas stutzeri]